MDQAKIGRFIKERRKAVKLTQEELAEKLEVSSRAISKWENGACLPDADNMVALCEILGITVNDLFNGGIVDMSEAGKKSEERLVELAKSKQEADKRLLTLEIVILTVALVNMLAMIALVAFASIPDWLRYVLIAYGVVVFLTVACFATRIEQKAGYYECEKCHYKYEPSYLRVLFAPHVNRTRYMKCPHCKKYAWHNKRIGAIESGNDSTEDSGAKE